MSKNTKRTEILVETHRITVLRVDADRDLLCSFCRRRIRLWEQHGHSQETFIDIVAEEDKKGERK
ncbi:MAG: hypothetical protein JO314_10105 [Acidobacteria bacterium]|nr:hypothetical protein [Acidobacteriota bacterium]